MRSTRIVTARVLGDPPPWRAGAAPDCEDARVAARREEMRKHFGVDGDDQLEKLLADRERLKPRRYRAPEVKPADGRNLPFVVVIDYSYLFGTRPTTERHDPHVRRQSSVAVDLNEVARLIRDRTTGQQNDA